jgi:hypothetical protein
MRRNQEFPDPRQRKGGRYRGRIGENPWFRIAARASLGSPRTCPRASREPTSRSSEAIPARRRASDEQPGLRVDRPAGAAALVGEVERHARGLASRRVGRPKTRASGASTKSALISIWRQPTSSKWRTGSGLSQATDSEDGLHAAAAAPAGACDEALGSGSSASVL